MSKKITLARKLENMRAEGTLPVAELNAKISLALMFCDPGMTAGAKKADLREVTLRLLTHDFEPSLEPIDFKRWVLGLPGGIMAVANQVYPVLKENVPDDNPDEILEMMALRFTAHLSALTQVL